MQDVNHAYEAQDETRLRDIFRDWHDGPDGVQGDEIGAELIRIIRTIAQVERRQRKCSLGRFQKLLGGVEVLLPDASAGGKAMLAAKVGARDRALPRPLAKFTEITLTNVATLAAELKIIRTRGWAQQISEFEDGVNSVAAAIPRTKASTAAIVVFGPAHRLSNEMIERLAPLVIHAANEVASRLR